MTKEEIIAILFDGLKEQGIQQKDAAKVMHHDKNVLSWWKKNRRTPGIEQLIMLADMAGMEIAAVKKGE